MIRSLLATAAILATASAGTWKELTTLDVVALDLDFYNDTHGYISGFENGVNGIQLLKTVNGGLNWTSSLVATPLLPLSFAMATNMPNILVTSLFSSYISHDDGQTFNPVKGDHVFQPLSAYFEKRTNSFFVVGETVAISTDQTGETFRLVPVTSLKKNSTPRFGAFPTADTWYLSCGSQPQQQDDDPTPQDDEPTPFSALSRRLKWVGGNYAQVVKTTDGGKTWNSMFYNDTYYSMGIACADENNCCFTTEADQLEPVLGFDIRCTHDGGNTWASAFSDHNAGASLMDIQSTGDNSFVASGTASTPSGTVEPSFIKSKDGGKTWTVDTPTGIPQLALTAANFLDADHAYALGLDRFNSEAFIAYEA